MVQVQHTIWCLLHQANELLCQHSQGAVKAAPHCIRRWRACGQRQTPLVSVQLAERALGDAQTHAEDCKRPRIQRLCARHALDGCVCSSLSLHMPGHTCSLAGVLLVYGVPGALVFKSGERTELRRPALRLPKRVGDCHASSLACCCDSGGEPRLCWMQVWHMYQSIRHHRGCVSKAVYRLWSAVLQGPSPAR